MLRPTTPLVSEASLRASPVLLQTLPVLPLRGAVVYPGIAIPLSAGRPGTIAAVERALAGDRRLFAVAQRSETDDVGTDGLFAVGTIVRITQADRVAGGMQVLVRCEARAEAVSYAVSGDHMMAASVRELPPADASTLAGDTAFQTLEGRLRERALVMARKRGLPDDAIQQLATGLPDPGTFADVVAYYLELTTVEKQGVLETADLRQRCQTVLLGVEREIVRLEAQETLNAEVQQQLGVKYREVVLREQLKVIKKELGEEESTELEALAARLAALSLPDAARQEVTRELRRLERAGPQAPADAQVARTYLEWVADLPWEARAGDRLDLAAAERILDEDHHGLADVKERVLEFLAVHALRTTRGDDAQARRPAAILLFVGPPGVGKTSIAQSVARAMGRPYARVALGGVRDEADIRGHRRTYVAAMPGRILHALKQVHVKNPVLLLDEVDKLAAGPQGDPAAALLELLDPNQNATFTDHYLGVPFDCSEILFVATANLRDRIPGPLLDRVEIVEFSGYTEPEKLAIAKKHLVPRHRTGAGLTAREFALADDALRTVIREYTHEAGVRDLDREIGRLARKTARKLVAGGTTGPACATAGKPATMTRTAVRELLGRTSMHPEKVAVEDRIGVATGLFYTPAGGDILFVEATVIPGRTGELILTGQLGDVMKESARAALTYARARAQALGIDQDRLTNADIHIHVPAGATPKDGPSAGITMATALISALTATPVRRDVAMTGELTLTGRVLPVGGIKEKLLGAHRAGVKHVILPAENEADLDTLPAEVRRVLTVHLVGQLTDALTIAMGSGPGRTMGGNA